MHPTWKPHDRHGELTERSDLPDSVFAFPKERKEPLADASHVRNAIARFDQMVGVSDGDRELAFANTGRVQSVVLREGVSASSSAANAATNACNPGTPRR